MIDIEQIKQANRDIIIKDIKVSELSNGIYDIYAEVKNEYKTYDKYNLTNIVKIKNLESNIIDDIIIIKTKFLLEEVEAEKNYWKQFFEKHEMFECDDRISKITPTSVLFSKIEKEFHRLYTNNKAEMIMFVLVKLPNSFTYNQLMEMKFEELYEIHSNLVKYLKTN